MMRNEYPRIGFVRDSFILLNGIWDFEFDDQDIGHKEKWYRERKMPMKINVPFAFQSALSGIRDPSPHDRFWYHRTFKAPLLKEKERLILHFDGVDYYCEVYLNGDRVCSHYGSATRFSVDITDYLQEDNDLVLYAFDSTKDVNFPRGKQDWEEKSHVIWYTRTSGIYKTVWMEKVHEVHLNQVFMTPLYDEENLQVIFSLTETDVVIKTEISYKNEWKKEYVTQIAEANQIEKFSLRGETENRRWDIGKPNLFDVVFRVYQNGNLVDEVKSYFGFRKIETRGNRVYLNDHPIYQKLILNQSYFPDGILTPSSAEDLKKDILLMKEYGFNGCRLHQKVEEEYFYYYADHEGFLVWCESPSSYRYSLNNPRQMINEWISIVKQYYNFPSIIVWTPLNESWGVEDIGKNEQIQAHALSLYYTIKSLDSSRLVIGNDGWEQTKTDLLTVHNYNHGVSENDEKYLVYRNTLMSRKEILRDGTGLKKLISLKDYNDTEHLPILLSEFAGVSFEHNGIEDSWGYTTCRDNDDYIANLKRIFDVLDSSPCIEGFCLTQFSDVEQETNGIVTYERKHKIQPARIREIIEGVKREYGRETV